MTVTLSVRPSNHAIEPLVYVYGEPRGPLCVSPFGEWIPDGESDGKGAAFYFDGEALMVKSGSSSTVRILERPVGPGWNLVPVPGVVVVVGTDAFSVQKGHERVGDTASGHSPPESRAPIAPGDSTLFGHIGDLAPATRIAIDQVDVGPSLGDGDPDEVGAFDAPKILLERAGAARPARSDGPAHTAHAYSDISPPVVRSRELTELGLPIGAPPAHARCVRNAASSNVPSPDLIGHRGQQLEQSPPRDPNMDGTVVDLDWAPESGPRRIAPSRTPPEPESQTSFSQTSYSWLPRSRSPQSIALGGVAILIAMALGIAAFFLLRGGS